MKLIAKIIIVAVIFIAGFYLGGQQVLSPSNGNQAINQGNQASGEKAEISVSLMLDFGNGQVRTFAGLNLAQGSTVFDLLKKVTADNDFEFVYKDYGEAGAFIEAIGDIANDAKGDRFWQYWVNNDYAPVGASAYQLKDKDIVEWKFIRGQIN